jgi:hypothetical protein
VPPAVVALALVAVGVPSAFRALLGRPRNLLVAWLIAAVAAVLAQAAGELFGWRTGTLGDTQLLGAAVGAILASILAMGLEGGTKET